MSSRSRRDPRSERAARDRRVAPAGTPADSAPARQRRDPRRERGNGRRQPPTHAGVGPAPRTGVVRIASASHWVLAVPDLPDGSPDALDRQLLGAARRLAGADGGVLVAVFAAGGGDWGALGADRVVCFTDTAPDGLGPEVRCAAIAQLSADWQPRHVLFPERPAGGADLGRRVAATLDAGVASHVCGLEDGRAVSRANGAEELVHEPPPRTLLLEAEVAEPWTGDPREARPANPPNVAAAPRLHDLGRLPVDPATVPLGEADFIVAAGAGVRDWQAFHALTAALGAVEGGSRVVCDAGHLARDRQVGASGTLVRARCYLALGISGAPQHLQGIGDCEHVLAVNTDPHAELLKRADVAVVGDAQAIMRALLERLEVDHDAP